MNVRNRRRAVVTAALGNAFEWYDFTIYALMSIYIAGAFFPGGGTTLELVKAFLAFGLGFVVRPVGAVVLGAYADRVGRKAVLMLTLGIMSVGTAILGLAPTYAAIGVGAPMLIMVGRSLQGFSAGGEFGGAAALLVEHAPADRRARHSSWLQASMGLSNIMAVSIAFLVTTIFTRKQLADYAWRLPFLFGLLIAPIGLLMRRTLEEGAVFKREQAARPARRWRDDVGALVGEHRGALAQSGGLAILLTVSSYVLVIFMPIYVQKTFHFPPQQAFAASVIGNAALIASCAVGGHFSDRLGRRPVLLAAATALGLCAYPLLSSLQHHPTFPRLICVQTIFCIATGAFAGPSPAAMAEAFPVQTRGVGVSVSYNLAVALFSGFAPAALTWSRPTAAALSPQPGICPSPRSWPCPRFWGRRRGHSRERSIFAFNPRHLLPGPHDLASSFRAARPASMAERRKPLLKFDISGAAFFAESDFKRSVTRARISRASGSSARWRDGPCSARHKIGGRRSRIWPRTLGHTLARPRSA